MRSFDEWQPRVLFELYYVQRHFPAAIDASKKDPNIPRKNNKRGKSRFSRWSTLPRYDTHPIARACTACAQDQCSGKTGNPLHLNGRFRRGLIPLGPRASSRGRKETGALLPLREVYVVKELASFLFISQCFRNRGLEEKRRGYHIGTHIQHWNVPIEQPVLWDKKCHAIKPT